MSKPKRKTQRQNFLQYLLNEFILFRYDFSFMTHLSPEQAANNLRKLNDEKQGCGRSRRIIAEVPHGFSEYSFEVKTEQVSKSTHSQSAKATGTIFADDDGMTIIEGSIIMGSSSYWIAIIILLGLITVVSLQFSGIPREPFLCALLSYAGTIFCLWLQVYRDRNYLIQVIDYAINGEKAKHISHSR